MIANPMKQGETRPIRWNGLLIFPLPPEHLGRDGHPLHDAEAGLLQQQSFPIPVLGQEMIAAQEKEGGVDTVYRLQAKGGIGMSRIQFPEGAVVDPQQVRCLDNRAHSPSLTDRQELLGRDTNPTRYGQIC